MCKLFIMTNTSKIKDIRKTAKTVSTHITKSERDGFGYMVQGDKGIFGERSIQKSFESRIGTKKTLIDGLPIIEVTHNTFGVPSKTVGPAVFHGRTSTNDVNILNTHPIEANGWYLSHNGVVSNKGPQYAMRTTNDTEHLVHYMSAQGITAIESHLTGYYAFGAIDPEGQLHLVRDNQAPLYMGWSQALETYFIGTTIDLIEAIAKDLDAKIGHIEKLADNMYSLWDGNDIVSYQDINPRGSDRYEDAWKSKSLGYLKDPYHGFNDYGTVSPMAEPEPSYRTSDRLLEVPEGPSELDLVDDSYTIWFGDNAIEATEFHKMTTLNQLQCVIERPDGTLVDMEDVA